ncbi:hypothetical protein P5_0048 [Aeromonas phage P5]|nr:hypothetical protein P5_0048 [Aeromonas phage P5]
MSDEVKTPVKELAKLMKRYAATQVALSWKGAQAISDWEAIEYDAELAKRELENFVANKMGGFIKL